MNTQGEARRNLARGGAIGFVGAAASALLGFALTVLLARLLGTAGSGVVAQATGVFAVVMALAKVGLDSTAIYLLPRLRIDSPEEIRACLNFMVSMSLGISFLAVLVLEAATPLIWGGEDPATRDAIRVILWFVPIGSLTMVATAALRALGNMRDYVLVQNIMLPGLRPILITAVIALGGSLTTVSASWAAPFLVILVASWAMLLRHLPEAGGRRWPTRLRRHQIVAFAVPRTLTAGLEQALTWLDVLIVGLLAGNAAAGIYGGASRFIQAGLIVDSALRIVVSPQFSRLLHLGDLDGLRRLYSTATIWLVLFATPIHLLMAVHAPALMAILGREFIPGAHVLVILCVGAMATFLAGNIHSLLLMSGRSGWAAFNKVVVLTLNVCGNLVFIPRHGIGAAAAVWAVCMVVDAALATLQVVIFIGIRPNPREFLTPLLAVFVSVGIPDLIVAHFLGRGTVEGVVAALIIVVPCFFVMCRLLANPLHLAGLGTMLKAKRGRRAE